MTFSKNDFCNFSEQYFKQAGCFDIPCGFQDLNPDLFVIIGALVGDALSGKLPFNVQNAVGNWLELVGQMILTYNAQQQYLQSGPGLPYSPTNKNISNMFCTQNEKKELVSSVKELQKQLEKMKKEMEKMKK
ncbi:hypothetical protein [Inconstantimicrobium mannanitabidum]|uniref:Uncharacterized protein n=1 Tax=Inconstantimicrobium mannanitabidum TaxID=1604901 RepID=A0ACB5RC95_9CLOT|nr:hypothetical protein [Clostridium sp. TW13]GKX66696.1 hypothetical protein rsdtw13_19540 [Clostridium sp. TW13]